MRKIILSTIMLAFCCVALSAGLSQAADSPAKGEFHVNGIGGGGGMYVPTISPNDPKLMFLTCDMGGVYRSDNAGKSWNMLNWKQMRQGTENRPAFARDAILWASGNTAKVSRDNGKTWAPLFKGKAPWEPATIGALAITPDAKRLYIGTDKGLWESADGGRTWAQASQGDCHALLILGKTCYAAVDDALFASTDGGKWSKLSLKADKPVASLAGGMNRSGDSVLYAANKSALYQSRDEGKTWSVIASDTGADMVQMAGNQTAVAYAAQTNGKKVFVTTDGGKTWKSTFDMQREGGNVQRSWVQTELKWGYRIMPLGLGADPTRPLVAMVSTQGDFYATTNGGKSWRQLMNAPMGRVANGEVRYKSIGLEVTSSWEYLFDPFDANRTYITYTDIGFARSLDRGASWVSSNEGCPWSNTFYQLIFDPSIKGRLYAACSTRHDIPYWTHVSPNNAFQKGGVCVSDDYGATWHVLGKGLPAVPCTSIALDPKSPPNRRTLYATMYEKGVYRSTDGGRTWQDKSDGLGNPGNMHAFMVKIQPGTGDIFCSITATRQGASSFPVAGGLWKSTDGGDHWTDLTHDLGLKWPGGFALDPRDPNVIYLTASTPPGPHQGGLYKTVDGGKSWHHIVTDSDLAKIGGASFSHCAFVTLHPQNPDYVYLSTATHGLFVSTNTGKTWQHFANIPFPSVTRVTFDPKNPKIMYVATFGGGIWSGNYLPE